jgi:ketosteroid isomerase-like protein
MTTREQVAGWVAGYERVWRTAGTDRLVELFTENASYRTAPYREPSVGLDAIAAMWEREREGSDERFEMTSDIVAVDGDTAVVRAEVRYAGPPAVEYRDLWVMRFAEDGRCRAFEEWPFWPGQPLSARG